MNLQGFFLMCAGGSLIGYSISTGSSLFIAGVLIASAGWFTPNPTRKGGASQ